MGIYDVLTEAEQSLQNGHYRASLDVLKQVPPMLEDLRRAGESANDLYSFWGWYYQYGSAALAALNDPALVSWARELVDRFGTDVARDLLFCQDYIVLRQELRSAHTTLARAALEANDVPSAIVQIEACFKIKSGTGEHLDPFSSSYETKARVYLKASQIDPKRYRSKCHAALHLLEKKSAADAYRVRMTDHDVQCALKESAYLEYKSRDPIEKLRRGPKDESWPDALARYQNVRKKLKVPADYGGSNDVRVLDQETEARLADVERSIGVPIPAALRECYARHGAFRVRDPDAWGSLKLYASARFDPDPFVLGIVSAIEWVWGGRPEFAASFTPEQLRALNAQYFCFGHYFHDDNAYTHLMFDRAGRFDSLYYHQDDWDSAQARLRALLDRSEAALSFDALMIECIDALIERLVELKQAHDQEA